VCVNVHTCLLHLTSSHSETQLQIR
jgi:hypothetical protein